MANWTLNIDYPRIAWNSAFSYGMTFTRPVYYEFKYITAPILLITEQFQG